MIEEIMSQGDKVILSDMITCTILRGVFGQRAVAFRFDLQYNHVHVEDFLDANRERVMPFGAVSLLLKDRLDYPTPQNSPARYSRSVLQTLVDGAKMTVQRRNNPQEGGSYPYRCLINLHGFESSWVPAETGHWPERWSKPYLLYEFQGKHGKEIEPLLKKNLPQNCMVYF